MGAGSEEIINRCRFASLLFSVHELGCLPHAQGRGAREEEGVEDEPGRARVGRRQDHRAHRRGQLGACSGAAPTMT